MNIEVANRLVTLRKKFGYSQEDLAQQLGISRQAISKWERAESSPDTDNLIALSKLYNVSLDALLAADEESIENERYAQTTERETISIRTKDEAVGGDKIKDTKASHWYRVPFPLIPVVIYCLLGMLTGKWGIYWFVFLSIPIYYVTVTFFHLREIRKGDV